MADEDTVLSLVEAAKYCGVTRQGVEACMRAAGIPFEEKRVLGGFGPRVVRGVHKSTLDTFRAQGFLTPRPGRRGRNSGRRPGRKARKNIIV